MFELCVAHPSYFSTSLCSHIRILASACVNDPGMGMMSGCANYKSKCAQGSQILKCTETPIQGIF